MMAFTELDALKTLLIKLKKTKPISMTANRIKCVFEYRIDRAVVKAPIHL